MNVRLPQNRILTPRVRSAQYELIRALGDAIKQADMLRPQAEAGLSSVMSDVWNEAEIITRQLPDDLERAAE